LTIHFNWIKIKANQGKGGVAVMQISLKAARVNAHLLQREAAEKIGVNTSTLVSWENGKTAPKAPLLKKLCEIYGVSINEIFLKEKSS